MIDAPAAVLAPASFLTPPATLSNGNPYGHAQASPGWKAMVSEAQLHGDFDTMDPKFGKQSADLDNFQELLDSPYVPDATSDSVGFTVDRTSSISEPMAFQEQHRKRHYPADAVVLEPSSVQAVEMDIIDDIDRHIPNFDVANPRSLLGKRSYGYGTQPSIQPQTPAQKRSRTASPDLSYSETLGRCIPQDPLPPFTLSHRDWITQGLPSRQPFVLTGILLDAFPHCWVRPVGMPVADPNAVTMATFRWCDLLLDATPADIVRLSFRMPTFTMGNGSSERWTLRTVEWTVPLDATWNDVALIISDSTPVDMSKVTFHGRHGKNQCVHMWNRASTVREFGPTDHQTFDIIGGEVGGG